MSYLNTLNDHPGFCAASPPMSPRISFSKDFAVEAQPPPRDPATPDPSFEFTVGIRPMIAADEIFYRGRMLPLCDSRSAPPPGRATTLRDELRRFEGGEAGSWIRQPKGPVRWKGLLGLGRAYSRQSVRKNDEIDDGSNSVGTTADSPESYPGKHTQKMKRPSCNTEDAA